VLFGDRIYSDGHASAVRLLCPTITATLQQSIHCAPLLWPHFSSPFIVPHYYGRTSPVHSLCPTIMAALQQSIHCAPLIQHHISSPASFSHSFDHTPRIQLWCSPVTSTPAAQSGSQYYGYKSSLQLLSPSIKATGSPALVSHCCDHINNPVMVLPFCGHTGCPVRLPLSWPHIISAVIVLSPTALRIDTEICWSI